MVVVCGRQGALPDGGTEGSGTLKKKHLTVKTWLPYHARAVQVVWQYLNLTPKEDERKVMTKELAIGVLVFVLAFAVNLQAQGDRGIIRGTVLDPTGAAVPGATVTVTNTGTGADTATSTSGSGLYNVAQLVPGTYVVSVELTGFKRAVADGVEVNVGAVVGLDFTLELGAVAESVEVTAAAPQLRTETTEVGTVLPQVVLTDLPIEVGGSGRRPISFIFLAPGASAGGAYRPEGDVRSNPALPSTRESMVASLGRWNRTWTA